MDTGSEGARTIELSEQESGTSAGGTEDARFVLSAFDARADAWEEYTATPLGRLRQDLTLRHLARHLGSPPSCLTILDAGGGTGGYGIPLAAQGHRVCILDFSAPMLAIARDRARRMDPPLLERVEFCCAGVQDASLLFASEHFDVVLCHTLLEYVEQPDETIGTLASVLRPGGMISLLFVTPYADALRWALVREDLDKARLSLSHQVSSADLFGLPRRAFPAGAIRESLVREGMEVLAEYGIRVFADYLPPERLADPDFFSLLMELEAAAGTLSPYKDIARYTLIVGRKSRARYAEHGPPARR